MNEESSPEEPIMHVSYICPLCRMSIKPPVSRLETITWVEGRTRHYAHARCYAIAEEQAGLDNGGTME